MMGAKADVQSHRSGSDRRSGRPELCTVRCSFCGEEFDKHEKLIEHIDITHQRELSA